jgi:hypothetical protein
LCVGGGARTSVPGVVPMVWSLGSGVRVGGEEIVPQWEPGHPLVPQSSPKGCQVTNLSEPHFPHLPSGVDTIYYVNVPQLDAGVPTCWLNLKT